MPLLADRSVGKIVGALFQQRHYKAFVKMGLLSGSFSNTLKRYLTGKGEYPCRIPVKTPLGTIHPTLYSYYDLLTLNEIFFREDYAATASDRVIVDIGSNIGLSALYFLTRNVQARCYLYEPDARNVGRMKENLAQFSSRCVINSVAVSDQSGMVKFGLDVISGRYGGLEADFGEFTTVPCVHINSVLKDVLAQNEKIDILKIDTEGTEIRTIQATETKFLGSIGKIYLEAHPDRALYPDLFYQKQYGTVCRMLNKNRV